MFTKYKEGDKSNDVYACADESYLTNGYLDTIVDWIPGMEGIRIKDLPSMVRTTDPNDQLLNFTTECTRRSHEVPHQIFHTFDELEPSIVKALSSMFSHVYTIGPLQLLLDRIPEQEKHTQVSNFNGYSLMKEEPECLQWLRSKEPNSVIFVNFGSSPVMSLEDLIKFGWGLAESGCYFLWIIRSNLVVGGSAALPREFEEPEMIDCRYICKEWVVGLEMGNGVKREEVKRLIQELIGEGGVRMRNKAMYTLSVRPLGHQTTTRVSLFPNSYFEGWELTNLSLLCMRKGEYMLLAYSSIDNRKAPLSDETTLS
ncbi:hypothetical protein L6452_32344 [Arctium lappa]|uniref:Uncharacterized protein n=1 Tax=Arctium lappa TaxID=4217 RepID=A0ACB8Z3F0_ARCLA|nr:hypothetical protein L6452_32344 [Arctium lappa]